MNVDVDSKLFAIDTVTDTLIQACCRKGMKYQICSLNKQKALLFGSKKSRKGTSRTIFAHLTYLSGSFKRREGFQHCKLLMRSQNRYTVSNRGHLSIERPYTSLYNTWIVSDV